MTEHLELANCAPCLLIVGQSHPAVKSVTLHALWSSTHMVVFGKLDVSPEVFRAGMTS
jgi:hypothetical protein